MKGHTFISAHFCNDDRNLVEALWEKDGKNVVQYIEANDDSKAWKTLLTHTDIDTLHEATYKHIKEQNEVLEDTVIHIAKRAAPRSYTKVLLPCMQFPALTYNEELPFQQRAGQAHRQHFQSYQARQRTLLQPHQALVL